jgi:hypothetical protein
LVAKTEGEVWRNNGENVVQGQFSRKVVLTVTTTLLQDGQVRFSPELMQVYFTLQTFKDKAISLLAMDAGAERAGIGPCRVCWGLVLAQRCTFTVHYSVLVRAVLRAIGCELPGQNIVWYLCLVSVVIAV